MVALRGTDIETVSIAEARSAGSTRCPQSRYDEAAILFG